MKKNKSIFYAAILIIAALIASYFIFFHSSITETVEESETISTSIDKNIIAGSWIRTDAEYQIKISDVSENGVMSAQYFNPRPINVSKAEWAYTEGFLKVYIELRDENYPGSNYNLTYIPERDLLVGDYFQAVEGLTFYVEFRRNK
ncbi:MAG TPA: hypothetical protein VF870_06675 [Ignavibacteriaceae bacterium]